MVLPLPYFAYRSGRTSPDAVATPRYKHQYATQLTALTVSPRMQAQRAGRDQERTASAGRDARTAPPLLQVLLVYIRNVSRYDCTV